ncbi:MAG: HAD family phosphatase [Patescibacteria group bacterium]
MKPKKRKVAVFDIDGTVFRSSLLIELTEMLIADKVFPAEARRVYTRAYSRWLERRDPYGKYINAVIRAFERYIRGVREKDFVKVVDKVAAFHRNRVYRYTRDLIKELKRKGYYLLAISHSPKYVVEKFAKQMGFHKVYGRILEMDNQGRFTGQTSFIEFIFDKSKIFARAAEKENLTLRGSVGVGDTESDIKFLEMVERPICFNPNQVLYQAARRRGWPVVVERKDVVYDIKTKR